MTDTVAIPEDLVEHARDYWDEHGTPDLREPAPGERCYFVGWSNRQDEYVLLSADIDDDDNYDAARDAYCSLYDLIPTTFTAGSSVVGELKTGFWDSYGNETTEITFPELWHATLLQHALDKARKGICLRMTSGYYLSDRLDAHAAKAKYSIRPGGLYSSFRHMSIRRELGTYVRGHYERTGGLPFGQHTLPSGIAVTFPEE